MGRLEENWKESGIKLEVWREAAREAGSWFRRGTRAGRTEAFMRELNDTEMSRAAALHATVPTATLNADTKARSGGYCPMG